MSMTQVVIDYETNIHSAYHDKHEEVFENLAVQFGVSVGLNGIMRQMESLVRDNGFGTELTVPSAQDDIELVKAISDRWGDYLQANPD